MPFPDIKLDDRRFEDIVNDAKRRIPLYTPEWTDLNDSDPGITLVQVFAWLTEMILYRLNRVPDRSYLKFLKLIGIAPNPPKPATADLTFKLTTKDLPEAKEIPQGTQVALADSPDGGPVIFETNDNLYAVGAEIAAIQSYDGGRFQLRNESSRGDGNFFYAFGPQPQRNAAFYIGLDRVLPPGRHRLVLYAFTADLIEEGQGVSATAPEAPPPVVGYWEYWAGDAGGWRRVDVIQDETASLTRSGAIQFNAPTDWRAVNLGLLQRPGDPPYFWLRFRIEEELGPGYEIPPRIEDAALNTISATNAVTERNELLGASNGTPNQEFRLAKTPVLPDTLLLEVNEAQESENYQSWQRVDDFAGSGRDSRHYTLELSTGIVRFGDGKNGKIPLPVYPTLEPGSTARSRQNGPGDELSNIRATIYRWGGGRRGNAGAKTITALQSPVPYVATVTNLRPSSGGQDEETVEEAKLRGPQAIRTGSRAVTASDFEYLATQTPGARIRRAKALPLHSSTFRPMRSAGAGLAASGVPVPGVVTVLVVPESPAAKPMPSEETRKQVAGWLSRHRLITTELYAAAPVYRKVEIVARVIANPTARSSEVATALSSRLLAYFHPLTGGGEGQGWDFGGDIYFSEIFRQILTTPGVARVETADLTIFVDDERQPQCKDIPLGPDELVYSEKHDITVSYE
jgi:predicted phage baseplate assembly protein